MANPYQVLITCQAQRKHLTCRNPREPHKHPLRGMLLTPPSLQTQTRRAADPRRPASALVLTADEVMSQGLLVPDFSETLSHSLFMPGTWALFLVAETRLSGKGWG